MASGLDQPSLLEELLKQLLKARAAILCELNMVISQGPTHAPEGASELNTKMTAPPCRLLMLPRELRDKIYKDVVIVTGAVIFNLPWLRSPRQPQILRACHQIRTEASPWYYSLNRFAFACGQKVCGDKAKHVMPNLPATFHRMQHITLGHFGRYCLELWTLHIGRGLREYELDYKADCGHTRTQERFGRVKSWLDNSVTNGNEVLTAKLFRDLMTDIVASEELQHQ